MIRESSLTQRSSAGEVKREASTNHPISVLKDVSQTLSRALETIDYLKIAGTAQLPNVAGGISFYNEVCLFEISLIRLALRHSQGNQRRAASLLGLKTTTLNSKIKAYNIDWRNPVEA